MRVVPLYMLCTIPSEKYRTECQLDGARPLDRVGFVNEFEALSPAVAVEEIQFGVVLFEGHDRGLALFIGKVFHFSVD